MMTGLYYLLEVNLYLAVFYGFYRLFLHRETFYTLNRYYLISTTIFAFILPLLQFGYLYNLMGLHSNHPSNEPISDEVSTQQGFTISLLMIYLYFAVAAVYLSKLALSVYQIISRLKHATKSTWDRVTFIELQGTETAFSFFNLLFINPDTKDKDTVIRHEMVHIRQKHSADIVFFEIVQTLCWFNPVSHLIKKDIRLLHEYIADDSTTQTIQKHEYALFLIQNSFGVVPKQLTSQIFNQSILKMRINMLNQKRSAGRARLKILLIAPIIGGMLSISTLAFAKDYAILDLYPEKYSTVIPVRQDSLKKKQKVHKFPPPIVKADRNATTGKSTVNKSARRFPPPIVKYDKVKFPPPTIKKDRPVKFPPPIVKEDVKEKEVAPPPPPVEPAP